MTELQECLHCAGRRGGGINMAFAEVGGKPREFMVIGAKWNGPKQMCPASLSGARRWRRTRLIYLQTRRSLIRKEVRSTVFKGWDYKAEKAASMDYPLQIFPSWQGQQWHKDLGRQYRDLEAGLHINLLGFQSQPHHSIAI